MTREEAIILLKTFKITGDRNHEAFDMAIKALKQEPCGDAISKDAVLEIINFEEKWLLDAKSHNEDTKIAFSAIKSKISELVSVNPNRKAE